MTNKLATELKHGDTFISDAFNRDGNREDFRVVGTPEHNRNKGFVVLQAFKAWSRPRASDATVPTRRLVLREDERVDLVDYGTPANVPAVSNNLNFLRGTLAERRARNPKSTT